MFRRIAWYSEVCVIILITALYMLWFSLKNAYRRSQVYMELRRLERLYRR